MNILKGGSLNIKSLMHKCPSTLYCISYCVFKLAPIFVPLGFDALIIAVACRIAFNINIGPPRWYCHTGHYECMLRSSLVPSLDFDLGKFKSLSFGSLECSLKGHIMLVSCVGTYAKGAAV